MGMGWGTAAGTTAGVGATIGTGSGARNGGGLEASRMYTAVFSGMARVKFLGEESFASELE